MPLLLKGTCPHCDHPYEVAVPGTDEPAELGVGMEPRVAQHTCDECGEESTVELVWQ